MDESRAPVPSAEGARNPFSLCRERGEGGWDAPALPRVSPLSPFLPHALSFFWFSVPLRHRPHGPPCRTGEAEEGSIRVFGNWMLLVRHSYVYSPITRTMHLRGKQLTLSLVFDLEVLVVGLKQVSQNRLPAPSPPEWWTSEKEAKLQREVTIGILTTSYVAVSSP